MSQETTGYDPVPDDHPAVTLHDVLTAINATISWGSDQAGRDTVARYLAENVPQDDPGVPDAGPDDAGQADDVGDGTGQ